MTTQRITNNKMIEFAQALGAYDRAGIGAFEYAYAPGDSRGTRFVFAHTTLYKREVLVNLAYIAEEMVKSE